MAAISEEAQARGAGIALVSAQSEEALAWNIQSALVDGFVLLCIENGEKLVELTRERQLPFVALAPVLRLAFGRMAADGERHFARTG